MGVVGFRVKNVERVLKQGRGSENANGHGIANAMADGPYVAKERAHACGLGFHEDGSVYRHVLVAAPCVGETTDSWVDSLGPTWPVHACGVASGRKTAAVRDTQLEDEVFDVVA